MKPDQNDDIKRLEGEMDKLFNEVLGKSDGMVKVAHPSKAMSNTSYQQYRSSFLTLGDMQIPDDYRDIFKWCRYFFKFDSLIGPAVRSLATFPVTEYIMNDSKAAEKDESLADDDESDEYFFYKRQMDEIGLNKHLIEVGYDYFLYGNCVVFGEPGYTRMKYRDEDGNIQEKKELVWKSIERLDVTRLRIDTDPKTKKSVYYYDIPAEMKRIIRTKKPKEKYDKIPKIFKQAVEKKGLVKLRSDFVFHLSMPSESGDSNNWGTPPVLHAMKLILYTNVLRQAQEAIAYEHIIPRRIYFFQDTENFSPDFNFGKIADDFAYELRKQLNDPNYQVISPIPVQQIQHGGQGRSLLLVPEIEQLQGTILAAMGVPKEFVFGGVSYSGSTISLRILENQFITYRTLLHEYVNGFLIKGLAKLRGEWEVSEDDDKMPYIEFADLKMQDDIQQKQLMIQLNSQGKLPDEILFEKVLGLDSDKTNEMLFNEQKRKLDEQLEIQKIQIAMQAELQQFQMQNGITPTPEGDPNAGGQAAQQPVQAPQPETGPTNPQIQEGAPAGNPAEQGQPEEQGEVVQGNIEQQSIAIAQALLNMTEPERAHAISRLPEEISKRAMMYYHELKYREESDNGTEVNMSPLPEKLPPRRSGGV